MRIKTRVRYAVRLMADIMIHGKENNVPLKDVAERQNLSKRYLSHLAIHLKNAQLLKSVWGMNGGYKLGRHASEIRIIDIMEAVDGPVNIIDCISDPTCCERHDYCECLEVWKDINNGITSTLKRYTLEDLACVPAVVQE